MRSIGVEEMVTIYGIKNCGSVKKAEQLIKSFNFPVEIHDFVTMGITSHWIKLAIFVFGIDKLVNKSSTTYRSLNEYEKKCLLSNERAIEIIEKNPKVLKRPIIMYRKSALIGFDEDEYRKVFDYYSKVESREN